MEALTSLGINWKLFVAQAVNFLLLLIVLRKFLFIPLMKMLSDRKDKIVKGMKDAEAAAIRLAQAEKEARGVLAKASDEAAKLVEDANQDATKSAAAIVLEANKKADLILRNAQDRAKTEEDKILGTAKAKLGELVILATEKIMGRKPDQDDIGKIVKEI
jgi:F-type H+-transporting ATPase subunit b